MYLDEARADPSFGPIGDLRGARVYLFFRGRHVESIAPTLGTGNEPCLHICWQNRHERPGGRVELGAGIEPATCALQVRCSAGLSYPSVIPSKGSAGTALHLPA